METRKILVILVLALGLMVCQAKVSEAGPMGTAFTYQGHLYDANHVANGLYDLAFKLYDANVGGSKAGTDVNIADVDVIDGYFTVELDFGSDVFDGSAVWLEIGVRPGELEDPNVYTTLSPRQRITPTPYALYATAATLLNAADGTPANVVYVDEVGNVGISTMSPGAKLDVAGNQNIRGDLNFSEPLSTIGFANDGQINLNGDLMVTSSLSGSIGAGTSMELEAGSTMDLRSAATMTITTPLLDIAAPVDVQSDLSVADNVGIGTTNPSSKLHVEDNTTGDLILTIHNQNNAGSERLYFGTSTGSDAGIMVWGSTNPSYPGKWRFFNNKTSAHYDWVTNGSVKMTLANNGNVGIGITNPDEKLTVDGTIKSTTSAADGRGVYGYVTNSGDYTNYGGYFTAAGTFGRGVYGYASNSGGTNYGGYFSAAGGTGRGVYGKASGSSGIGMWGEATNSGDVTNYGGWFEAAGTYGRGVYGKSSGSWGRGVFGYATGSYGGGVEGYATGTYSPGVYGVSSGSDGVGVYGQGYGSNSIGVQGNGEQYDFYASGNGDNYGSASSIRWKSDVRAIDDPLGKILRLRGVYFNWDEEHGGGHDVGMIAEEVGEVLPEIVMYEENGVDAIGMDYSKVTPLLVEAVKELKGENEMLKERVEALEKTVQQLARGKEFEL